MSQFHLVHAVPRMLVIDVEAPFLHWRFILCHLPSIDDYVGRVALIATLEFYLSGRRNFTMVIDANSRLDALESSPDHIKKKYEFAAQHFFIFFARSRHQGYVPNVKV